MTSYGVIWHTHTKKRKKAQCSGYTHVRKTQIRMHGMCELLYMPSLALEKMTHAPLNHDDAHMLFQFSGDFTAFRKERQRLLKNHTTKCMHFIRL